MKKCYFIICLIFDLAQSSEFKLICTEKDKSFEKSFSKTFVKIINFEQRTVVNYSGNYFDKVVLFDRKEIIFQNNVFEILSTFKSKVKYGQVIKVWI